MSSGTAQRETTRSLLPLRSARNSAWLAGALACLLAGSIASAGEFHLDGRTFKLPDGFTIARVAGPPLVDRPIEADFDEQGRLYVTDSSGSSDKPQKQLEVKPHRVLRLSDSHHDGHYDQRTVFAEHMMFPEGAMWLGGALYVAAPPSIWKLSDPAESGISNQPTEWFQGKTLTGCANDLHGPYLGPDGWIYWCKGAFAEQTYERPGEKPFVTRAAHIFRCRPDGSGLEPVMTGGMDNPIEIAFTPGGERILSSTFIQNPAGGHRDGLLHAVYGGIYGKVHDVIEDHPHTSPEVMPVLMHLGPAAVCGLTRYESDVFGPEYRDNLFATCFNLHKVTRHVLSPDGATFKSENSDFLICDSMDFHPTDVLEDADGSLLVIDTGGWYKLCCPTSQLGKPDVLGAIYRIRRASAPKVADPRGLKLAWDRMGPEELAKLLDDARPAVRKRAIQALADKKSAALPVIRQVLRSSRSSLARLNAVWAATRIDDAAGRSTARAALGDADETVRQAAAHSASVWRDREALSDLLALLSNPSRANRRVAAEAIGRIGDPSAIPALLSALAEANDRVLDHSLTYALIEIDDAKATAAGLANDNPRVRRAALIALDQMEKRQLDPATVAKAMTASDASLRETATWVAGRHPEWGAALAGVLRQRLDSASASELDRAELVQQLASLAKSPAIQDVLAGEIADSSASLAARRLALQAMADSGLRDVPSAWIEALAELLGHDASLSSDVVATAAKLRLSKPQAPRLREPLMRVASRQDVPAHVRLEALAAIPGHISNASAELFDFLVSQLRPVEPATQRLAAAQVLGRTHLTHEQLLALTDSIAAAGPLEIDRLLSAFEQSSDRQIGEKLVAALKSSKGLKGLRAESLRGHLAKFGPDVLKDADPLLASLNPDAGKQKAHIDELLATLPPGDVRRGQAVFNSPKAACVSCHAIGYVGGNVGPDLTRVGQIRTERDLLESIVYPSASFVQSFEPVMVITTDGDTQYGIVRRNDASEVLLVTGPQQEVRIPKSKLKEMRPGTVSIMPEGLDQQLSKQELADLLAFLKASK